MFKINTIVLMSCLVLFVGCGGQRVTKGSYAKVKTGMTLSEVEAILGPGTEQGSSDASFGGISIDVKSMVWQDEDKIISIMFSQDKVKAKSQIGL